MQPETREVYSGKGNFINVAKIYSIQTWGRYGERLQFHSATDKNEMWIRRLSEMKIRMQEQQEELNARLKHREIFEEYCRLDKRTKKFGIWKNTQ